MRIERVVARSFGPFSDQALDFASGMTVVYGPNESGKSTWHAAVYLGLCGVRRAQGPSVETKLLAERHKPWDLDGWAVSTVIGLEDGRRIELQQDLENKVHCSAVDADLGRDCSNEVINEGTPDGSRWLGLDRRSFRSTACVRQVEIQDVLEKSEALQEHLQRAAATAGTQETAAAAIDRLEDFRRERIGQNRRNSTKPLRRAVVRLEKASTLLDRARAEHERYVGMISDVETAELALGEAQASRQALEAAIATAEADNLERRVLRAREILAEVPTEPEGLADAGKQAQEVAKAVEAWKAKPEPVELDGPSSSELAKRLYELPPASEGDVVPHDSVSEAEGAWRDAAANLRHHENQRVDKVEPPETGGMTEDELRELVRELSTPSPPIDPDLEGRRVEAERKLEALPNRPFSVLLLVLAAVAAVAGVGLLFVFLPAALLLLVLAALASLLAFRKRGAGERASILEELRRIETELGTVRFKVEEAERRRAAANASLAERGLPTSVDDVRRLADLVRAAAEAGAARERWQRDRDKLAEGMDNSAQQLRQAIAARGGHDDEDVEAALRRYKEACAQRREQAAAAARRPALEDALAARRQAETSAEEAARARLSAEKGIKGVASGVGVSGGSVDELAAGLDRWLERHQASVREREGRMKQWQELQTLLDGSSLDELEAKLEEKRARARELSAALPASSPECRLPEHAEEELDRLRAEERRTAGEAHNIRGSLSEYSSTVVSVPEAEEELAAATAEKERIEKLDRVIEYGLEFLRQAQDRTHRTIAPMLKASLEKWLPEVTNGRYVEARVDPEALRVRVRGANRPWRDAG